MILKLIKSLFQSPKEQCFSLYNEAKKQKPDKSKKDYLKLVLLTKPPFDYQLDNVIEKTLNDFKTIEDLADFIADIPKNDYLWESRKRNLQEYKQKLSFRNNLFFEEFWL